MSFPNDQYAAPLQNLLESETTSVVNFQNFSLGYSLFHYDLRTNELGNTDNTFELTKLGEVSVRGRFGTPLWENVQLLIYSEFQEDYKVDKARVVTSSI